MGELLFMGVFFSVFARLRQLSGWLRWYWSAQVGVLLIGMMSLSLEDSKSVWIFLSLAVAAAAAERPEPVPEAALADLHGPEVPMPRHLEPVGR